MADVLTTERLSLRRPVREDIDAILRIIGDPETTRHDPGDRLTSRAEAEALFDRWTAVWATSGVGYLTVRRREAPEILGFAGVKPIRLHDSEVLNLYYRLAPQAWGQGIATEAATAVLAWARESLPHLPVIAQVSVANTASQRVVAKLGMHRAPGEETIYT